MTTCLTCRRPHASRTVLCAGCVHQLRAWLRELPLHHTLLTSMLQPDRGPAQRGGTGRAHAPLPARLDVLDLLGPGQPAVLADPHGDQDGQVPMTGLLYGWACAIAGQHPSARRRGPGGTVVVARCDGPLVRGGLPGLCRWLDSYLFYALRHEWAAAMHEEVGELVRQVRGLTHTEPRQRTRTAPCPRCEAFALVTAEDQWYTVCQACDTLLTPDEYTEHRARVMPALVALAARIAVRSAA